MLEVYLRVIAKVVPGPIIIHEYELDYYDKDENNYWSRKFDDKEIYDRIFNDRDVKWKKRGEYANVLVWETTKDVIKRKLREWFDRPYD